MVSVKGRKQRGSRMSNYHFWLQRLVLNCCEITAVEQSIPTGDVSGLITLMSFYYRG